MSEPLGQKPWMTAPETAAVLDALEAAGGEARFVGGSVRNALLGAPVDDVDIATTLTPDAVMAALKAAGLKAAPTGVEHGTVTAIANGKPLEVTTLRRDVETDGRRAVVAFTTDWAEDAARRDFTLNALYADRTGALYDPTGRGLADLKARRIVFVGDAETRIREDYLRILRYFRFLAWYGQGAPDADALAACAARKDGLAQLAAERVSKELLKLFAADDPRAAVRLMADAGVLTALVPQATDLARFDNLVEIESEQLFTNDPLLRLAALLPDDQLAASQVANGLRLSNGRKDRLVAAMGKAPRIVSFMGAREIRRAVYQIGAQAFADRVTLAWAAVGNTPATHQWRGAIALGASWTPPAFPITGEEVIKSGVPKGPMVGEVLREVEAWWVDNDFLDDKLSAVERLKAVVQGMAY
jgi:poly(A) polymerase